MSNRGDASEWFASNSNSLTLSESIEYASLSITQRYERSQLLSSEPDDDDDDDEVVGDEEEDEEENDRLQATAATLQLMDSIADPEILKQLLSNMQARFQNFEDILTDMRCQLVEMHSRDEAILKRMASLNEEIAELNLLDNFEANRVPGLAGETFSDLPDYANEPLPPHLNAIAPPPPYQK